MAKSTATAKRPNSVPAGGTLYKRIVRVLQNEIVSGKHPVGARLPTESALCRRFWRAATPCAKRCVICASPDW